jgi:hypothetical protein
MNLVEDIVSSELAAVICRCLRAYHRLRERAQAAGGFWNAAPPRLREWQGVLAAATNKLQEFLLMDERERGARIERAEGSTTHVVVLKEYFLKAMKTPLKSVDHAVLRGLGYSLTEKVKVCRSCLQVAKSRGGKCCDLYANNNRMDRDIVMDMRLTPVCGIAEATGGLEEEE